MKDSTPQAVQASHELLLWLIPHLDKFPRARRFTLGERLESTLIDVLELLVEAAFSRVKQDALRRFARAFAEGELGWDDINPSVKSWVGHARHADTHGLRRAIFSEVKFKRERA
jgi:hypothetical protein